MDVSKRPVIDPRSRKILDRARRVVVVLCDPSDVAMEQPDGEEPFWWRGELEREIIVYFLRRVTDSLNLGDERTRSRGRYPFRLGAESVGRFRHPDT